MAVDSLEYIKTYETDGDDEFTITFPVQLDTSGNAKDIKVYYRDETGAETDITDDCSISGLVVTTPEAYAATTPASYVALVRWPDLKQPSTYQYGSNFPPKQIERDFDRIYYALQRLSGEINRSIIAPVTDGAIELVLPNKTERASSLIGFDSTGENIIPSSGSVAASTYMAELLDDTTPAEAAATLEVYTQTEVKTLYQEQAEDKRELGELFFVGGNIKDPVAFTWANRRNFFPAICLDAIESYEDISATNWVSLVPWLRAQKLTYMAGKTGEKYAFDVTNWAISSNVATLTFANTAGENAVLAALLEDKLVHGSYTAWRTITLGSAIGDITAGDYAITAVDAASRTVSFAFTHADNSGSGTFTVNFYHHRIAGSTTTARLFEASGRTLVSAGDAAGEEIAGLRRRDRMQGHLHASQLKTQGTASATRLSTDASGNNTLSDAGLSLVGSPIADPTNGTPRTGATTDPRAQVGHLYIHGRDYAA